MRPPKTVLRLILVMLILAAGRPGSAQEKAEVLKPADSNEARLNGLQPPEKVMDAIGVKMGMAVAEIGAGRGRYVVQLAVRVGESGQVYAEDIDLKSLQYLEKRCERGGLKNVTTILGDVTEPKLPEGELDLIFVISAYHHFADPIALMRNARSALKPTGMLAIGEWLPKESGNSQYGSPERIEAQMKKAGYRLERIEKLLEKNNMYIYIFRPVEFSAK